MIVRPSALGVTALAPAKLNLFLEVLGKRPDGYHEIETLMVAVDLYDTLEFIDDPSGAVTLVCDDPSLPVDGRNLVVKAALRLRAEANVDRGVKISLHKEIPAQAGLGGGSSDAAATLRALDLLWGTGLGDERLGRLAGEIGSDVAFFLHGPAAICRGRGERVEAVEMSTPLHFVLICPPVGVSTAAAFGALVVPSESRPIGPAVAALGDADALGPLLYNRLQAAAEAVEPSLAQTRELLKDHGPPHLSGHLMSGSGSAHFGLARDLSAARNAAEALRRRGPGRVRVVSCEPRDHLA